MIYIKFYKSFGIIRINTISISNFKTKKHSFYHEITTIE